MIIFNLVILTQKKKIVAWQYEKSLQQINPSYILNINLWILTWFPATIENRNKERVSQNYLRKLLKWHVYF